MRGSAKILQQHDVARFAPWQIEDNGTSIGVGSKPEGGGFENGQRLDGETGEIKET
jgi:hypothetical protein